ncbi:MAG: AraC family transcriptional regulator [Gammaproteobacteria bacterium]|nr:AraC family transcriptional regulator [Gammaproteobacteria bacterium]
MPTVVFVGKRMALLAKDLPIDPHLEMGFIEKLSDFGTIGSANCCLIVCKGDDGDRSVLAQLRNFKNEYPHIPILFCTYTTEANYVISVFRVRVWDMIILPSEIASLSQKINQGAHLIRDLSGERSAIFPNNEVEAELCLCAYKQKTAKAVEFVEVNYANKIRMDELAEVCGMSRDQLARYFKKEYKCTVRDFIKHFRIEKAKQMLIESDRTIEDVAYEVGFETTSLFNRLFKQVVGESPSAYKWRTE